MKRTRERDEKDSCCSSRDRYNRPDDEPHEDVLCSQDTVFYKRTTQVLRSGPHRLMFLRLRGQSETAATSILNRFIINMLRWKRGCDRRVFD
jgi:hypothetical protein